MRAFLFQYGYWAFYHALFDPNGSFVDFFLSAWKICPVLFWLMCFARGVPVKWLALLGVFLVHLFLTPGSHYILGALPFICLVAAKGISPMSKRKWAVWVTVLLSLFTAARMGMAILRPWGAFGMRKYGIMDDYDAAQKLKEAGYQRPLWASWQSLYVILDEPIPSNSFLVQINGTDTAMDWTKVNTRVYLLKEPDQIPYSADWTGRMIRLERGQFTKMLILTRRGL